MSPVAPPPASPLARALALPLALGAPALLVAGWVGPRPALLLAAVIAGAWAWFDERTGHDLAPRPPSRAARLGAPLLIVTVALIGAWPAQISDFLGDDFGYVRLFHDKPLRTFFRLGDVSEGIWGHPLDELRPVFALSFKLGLMLHGPSARGFLLDNLLLHSACCLLVYGLVRLLAPGRLRPALAAGLIFALLPVHAEPLAWITGKVDSLPTLFYLSTALLFVAWRRGAGPRAYVAAVLVYAVGVFSKEILVTLPALLLAFDVLLFPPAAALAWPARFAALVRVHAPFVATAAGFLALRRLVFESFAREGRVGAALLRQFAEQQPEKARALLLPFDAWTAGFDALGSRPLGMAPETAAAALAALLLGALAGCAAAPARRRELYAPAWALAGVFGLAFYVVTILPLLVTYASPRHLYLPSAGAAVALAVLLFPPTRDGGVRAGPARAAALLLLLGLHALLLRAALGEWGQAGDTSRRARAQIAAALDDLPAGRFVIVLGVPATTPRPVVWKFALPFALQPPFVARDVYSPYRVLEPPSLHSRPRAGWWALKREVLRELLDGPADEAVDLRVLRWNARAGELRARDTRPTRGLLRATAERVLGAPVDAPAADDATGAQGLVVALADAALRAPR
jgi:hypothetical protein